MYREMTPEEKLEYSSEIIEAIKKGGLVASLDIVEKYKKILSVEKRIDNTSTNVKSDISASLKQQEVQGNTEVNNVSPQEVSIYAEEHISAVQEDIREHLLNAPSKIEEQPIKRVLERPRNTSPNPWGDSKVVLPGELKL